MASLATPLQRLASRMISSLGRMAVPGHPGLAALQRASQRAAGAAAPAAQPPRLWLARRPLSSAAAPPRAAASQPDYSELDLALPSHCSGCGVPLQRDDPDAAGWVGLVGVLPGLAACVPALQPIFSGTPLCPPALHALRRYFQVPRKLLERLAAEQRALAGGGAAGGGEEEGGLEGLQAFEEDDGELVFDDVGPEVRKAACCWLLACRCRWL